MPVCLSVSPSVRPSVRRSVGLSVGLPVCRRSVVGVWDLCLGLVLHMVFGLRVIGFKMGSRSLGLGSEGLYHSMRAF